MLGLTLNQARDQTSRYLAIFNSIPATHEAGSEHGRIWSELKMVSETLTGLKETDAVAYIECRCGRSVKTVYTILSTARRRLSADERFCYNTRSR